MRRAMDYLYAGFYQKAKDDADKAVAAAPEDWETYSQRAEIEIGFHLGVCSADHSNRSTMILRAGSAG